MPAVIAIREAEALECVLEAVLGVGTRRNAAKLRGGPAAEQRPRTSDDQLLRGRTEMFVREQAVEVLVRFFRRVFQRSEPRAYGIGERFDQAVGDV